jgi:tetratricopeptide (TPR) repeat protein
VGAGGGASRAGDRGGAIGHLERARDLSPDLTPVLWLLARLREGAGVVRQAADAHVEFGKRSRAPARAAMALRSAARLYAEAVRDDEAAADALEELLLLDPEADVDFQLLEVILKQRGDLPRLIEVARRRAVHGAVEARRDRLIHLAELLRERQPGDAVEPLSAAVALDPHFIPALTALADLFASLGRTAEAVTTLRRVVAVAPDPRTGGAGLVAGGRDRGRRARRRGPGGGGISRRAGGRARRSGGPGRPDARSVAAALLCGAPPRCCASWRQSIRCRRRGWGT